MRRKSWARTVAAGLALALGASLALAQEDGGDRPRRPRRPEGRPGLGGPGGQRQPGTPFGIDLAEVREEMQRHRQEMQRILGEMRPLLMQIRRKTQELRQGGADREAIKEALKEFAPKRDEIAGQLADALATHHGNMAKILKDHRDAAARSIGRKLLERMGNRGGPGGGEGFGPRRRPGGDDDRPFPPRRRRPAPAEEGDAPENF